MSTSPEVERLAKFAFESSIRLYYADLPGSIVPLHHGWERQPEAVRAHWRTLIDRVVACARCRHERLNEEGICRVCGSDCRGIG